MQKPAREAVVNLRRPANRTGPSPGRRQPGVDTGLQPDGPFGTGPRAVDLALRADRLSGGENP